MSFEILTVYTGICRIGSCVVSIFFYQICRIFVPRKRNYTNSVTARNWYLVNKGISVFSYYFLFYYTAFTTHLEISPPTNFTSCPVLLIPALSHLYNHPNIQLINITPFFSLIIHFSKLIQFDTKNSFLEMKNTTPLAWRSNFPLNTPSQRTPIPHGYLHIGISTYKTPSPSTFT